ETRQGGPAVGGVMLLDGTVVHTKAIVLCTGTSLNGKLIRGEQVSSGGRIGEQSALGMSGALRDLGLELGRHKTGTPPRIDRRSIDYALAGIQPGSASPLFFSDDARFAAGCALQGDRSAIERFWGDPLSRASAPSPDRGLGAWRRQLEC